MQRCRTRIVAAVLVCVLVALAAGCDDSVENVPAQVDCVQLAQAIWDSQTDIPQERAELSSANDTWSGWLESVYNVDPDTVADGCVLYAQEGTYSDEVAVLVATDASAASSIEEKLGEYLERRLNTFAGYAPDEEYQLQRAQVARTGTCVALLAVADVSAARSAMESGLGSTAESASGPIVSAGAIEQTEMPSADPAQEVMPENAPSEGQPVQTLPPVDIPAEPIATSSSTSARADEYDHDAVLAAWQAGDASSLSGQNLAVYERAAEILGSIITLGMSQYDQELAVHNYLASNLEYDEKMLGHASTAGADPESFTPYGGLVEGKVICYGYSSSFQLLMDMLGIQCLTVDGTANWENGPHSWNMVNLDGDWYHVDVGWDDPVNGEPYLRYFNRASDDPVMRESNRKWDESAYPVAAGGPLAGPAEYAY